MKLQERRVVGKLTDIDSVIYGLHNFNCLKDGPIQCPMKNHHLPNGYELLND